MTRNDFIFVAGKKPRLEGHTSGQEYYLRTMISVLEEIGYEVKMISRQDLSSLQLRDARYIHVYYAPLMAIVKLRLTNRKASTCFHVYHVEDQTWSAVENLRWKLAILLSRHFINNYLVASRSVSRRLEKLSIRNSKIVKIEPFYSCKCDSFNKFETLFQERIKRILSERSLRFLLLGRFSSERVPLLPLIKTFKDYSKQYKTRIYLRIITCSSGVTSMRRTIGKDFTVEIENKYLVDEEKCNVYRETDFFLHVPQGNVAMNPPITILEAVYHGAIPFVTPSVLNDLDLPREVSVKSVQEIPFVLQELAENKSMQEKVKRSLAGFSYYYDKSRYVDSLETLVSGNNLCIPASHYCGLKHQR